MTSDSTGSATGTMELPADGSYLDLQSKNASVAIHMSLGAIDSMARDVIEGYGELPRHELEVGGLLLGRVEAGPRPEVWVERFQRIDCAHRFGPRFILDAEDMTSLEEAAGNLLRTGELAVVGLYRSHTRPGLQLEESDVDLIRRYFSDASDLVLLIKPDRTNSMSAQFFAWDPVEGTQPAGEPFPFRGSVLPGDTEIDTPDTAPSRIAAELVSPPEPEKQPQVEPAAKAESEAEPEPEPPATPRAQPRRLVPDFLPKPVEPIGSNAGPAGLYSLTGRPERDDELTKERDTPGGLRKWLPLLAAVVLVGGVLGFVLQPGRHGATAPAPAPNAEPVRPLGLYVDPAGGQTWRVVWNPMATALQGARSVQLFVRDKPAAAAPPAETASPEKEDQTRIELSARDLASATYEYRPVGNDVTFRLEVTDQSGRLSAESFRLMGSAAGGAIPLAPPPAVAKNPAPAANDHTSRITPARPTYRAPPVVAAGVRPRIKGIVGIDVRVEIDAKGRVISAKPVTKQHSGLEEYLAGRAVQAAKQWRFEPARENGQPVNGTQVIHFVFEK
jgi:hypothetical protein